MLKNGCNREINSLRVVYDQGYTCQMTMEELIWKKYIYRNSAKCTRFWSFSAVKCSKKGCNRNINCLRMVYDQENTRQIAMKGLGNDKDQQDQMFPEAYCAAITHSAARWWSGLECGLDKQVLASLFVIYSRRFPAAFVWEIRLLSLLMKWLRGVLYLPLCVCSPH